MTVIEDVSQWRRQAMNPASAQQPVELMTATGQITGDASGGTVRLRFILYLTSATAPGSSIYGLHDYDVSETDNAATLHYFINPFSFTFGDRNFGTTRLWTVNMLVAGDRNVMNAGGGGPWTNVMLGGIRQRVTCSVDFIRTNVDAKVTNINIALFRWDPLCWQNGGPRFPF